MRTPDENGRAVPFSISYRTYNRHSKTGGQLRSYQNAKLVMPEKQSRPDSLENLAHRKRRVLTRRDPNHWEHKTRNIKLPCGRIRKINTLFIIRFNGRTVVY